MSEIASIQPSAWEPLTQQFVFRRLLEAFSYPGRVASVARTDAAPVLSLLLATLVDAEIALADPQGLIGADDWRRLGARRAAPEKAHFIVARGDLAPAFEPSLGTLESPERGATVVLQVESLGVGAPLSLSGPGIDGAATLAVGGLDPTWLARRAAWNSAFPLGVDVILVDGTRLAALPRTTRIKFEGGH
ncbi:phosphonate C-P lyase system protein PhnH [Sedimenticola hydrogenitrophicus]|uniref:phosphonate C-P lyase system protein PhnH n=1 Tax=Sedimenticola hydrogenitrophicus TaxID=2967975 RepID=UPI0023AF636B|nr:phosphonate C-P lyase system protein PhnH [Sedimenticola hydrogenitrophicus]